MATKYPGTCPDHRMCRECGQRRAQLTGCLCYPCSPPERCRHCGRRKVHGKHRGLCSPCNKVPEIREQYPILVAKYIKKPDLIPDRDPRRLPEAPTEAPPGSPEKVAVLEARALSGYRLWHPQDLKERRDETTAST